MIDDDDFGDLYSDVFRPLSSQFHPHRGEASASTPGGKAAPSHGRPIDLNVSSDDEEILYGAPDLKNSNSNLNPNSAFGWDLNSPIQEKNLSAPSRFGLNLNSKLDAARIDSLTENIGDGLGDKGRVLKKGEGLKLPEKASCGSTSLEDDRDIDILVEEREIKDDDLVEKDNNFINKEDNPYVSETQKKTKISFANDSAKNGMRPEEMIPGLSGRSDNPRGSHFEDEWESEESEDDLQIVLNDNNQGPVIDEDDDGEPLVIVADNGDVGHHLHQTQMMMEERQEWGGEEGGPGADGEKDLGVAAKASGGGSAAPAVVQPKIAYSNHVFNHPFHSQFKYVRPGTAPLPGAPPAATGGIPVQVHPSVNMGPLFGRGRGDWRPAGIKVALPMQKGFHPGYGMPAWGVNAAGRGYGSGLDFTLPSHKTIFEVDIDSFEEKPWKLPSIDISEFFNFGLNEDSWKDYGKQLEQLRLETTMRSKICVYESGRAEQDYDPDLLPELAVAVGFQDIPYENANRGNADAAQTDLARASAHGRPPLPVGRPIPVETGSGDRLPAIDTKRPRMHDIDVIIEIVCHNPTDGDGMAEQQDNGQTTKGLGGGNETEDIQQDDAENMDSFSPSYNGQQKESGSRRAQLKDTISINEIIREDALHFPPEERSTKGRLPIRSPMVTATDNKRGKHITDNQNKEIFDNRDGKRSPALSSSCAIGSDGQQALLVGDVMNDGSVSDDKSFHIEREGMAVDTTTSDIPEDWNLKFPTKKQKLGFRVEQLSQEDDDDDGEDSKAARSRENSKARSGSSKNHWRFPDDVEDDVLWDRRPPRAGNIKRHYERDETERHMVAEGSSRRSGDGNSALRRHLKSADWKENDISEGSWHRRDEDHRGRRTRVEDARKRERGGKIARNQSKVRETEKIEKDEHQSRNQMDNGCWRGANHDHANMEFRQRNRDDNLKSRNEKVDDLHSKRRKEEAHISQEHAGKEDISDNCRGSSNRRKRERDNGSDQLKRDAGSRLKGDDVHHATQKEGGSVQRERMERQTEHDERYRIKQDEILFREREETRSVMRSGRTAEEKPWISHSRGKNDYKGSSRDYKDMGQHVDQLKQRDRVGNESFSLLSGHEDVYSSGNQLNNDNKRARYGKPSSRDGHVAYGSDTSRVYEDTWKGSSRKNKELESGDRSSLIPYKKNQYEHDGQISKKVNLRGRNEHQSAEVHTNHHSSRKHREEASSDYEQPDSGRGRSKLERWTSHKDRDFDVTVMPSSSLKRRDLDTYNTSKAGALVNRLPEESSIKSLVDNNDIGADRNNINHNVMEDKHLDTAAKLKKRSERFKLPACSEKDAMAIKKTKSESLPLGRTEMHPDSEIKSVRPPRKRRWTGN